MKHNNELLTPCCKTNVYGIETGTCNITYNLKGEAEQYDSGEGLGVDESDLKCSDCDKKYKIVKKGQIAKFIAK